MRIPAKPPVNWVDVYQADKTTFIDHSIRTDLKEFVRRVNDAYWHWDKVRLRPLPEGITAEQAWAHVEYSRQSHFVDIPVRFFGERQFKFWIPSKHSEWLSFIDQNSGGNIGTYSPHGVHDENKQYLYNSLMEEAIASSVLEGAVSTREVAKEMLRTSRKPRDVAEQMIANNYQAILEIRDMKQEKLTPAMLCHLQSVLTNKTLDDSSASGRFRNADDDIHVVDQFGEIVFTPPKTAAVGPRIRELCDFANTKSKEFIHPVIKAIALHFAIGFIHPFVDGNGRTARAIFYWFMLKNNYWLFEYLPISRIIVDAPIQYSRAYLYTETDDGDLTYFNNYHLAVVVRAINDLHVYLDKQRRLQEEAKDMVRDYPDLNLRQRLVLLDLLRHPGQRATITEHAGKSRVTYNTARADLFGLEKCGLFQKHKVRNKEAFFSLVADVVKRLGRGLNDAPRKKRKTPIIEGDGDEIIQGSLLSDEES